MTRQQMIPKRLIGTNQASRCIQMLLFTAIAIVPLLFILCLSQHSATLALDIYNPSNAQQLHAGRQQQQQHNSSNGQLRRMEQRANQALDSARDWSLRFGREMHQATQEATCHQSIRSQFDPANGDRSRRGPYRASVASIDWTRKHAEIVKTISRTMGWHEDAVAAIVRASEELAANHTYDENLPNVEYVDVHRLFDLEEMEMASPDEQTGAELEGMDQLMGPLDATSGQANESTAQSSSDQLNESNQEHGIRRARRRRKRHQHHTMMIQVTPQPLVLQPAGTPMPQDETQGEWQTPIKYAPLQRHPNFAGVNINTDMSAVHVPVHIYPGQPVVKNAIAWSEGLTRVFKNNFVQNPKLTNQYFASPHGFMRLFPAQKWQIPRTDPDLYDARMRPWYVAGASSRKDVVILVDSSGSMTGSRRDIAKGVVFEILDTLTDNDHFLVLKFNDVVQQVGVPACKEMRLERNRHHPKIPLKNTILHSDSSPGQDATQEGTGPGTGQANSNNATDIDSLYLLPANGRNVRYVKTNFTIPTSGIANFSQALVTAFEVLQKYQQTETLGSQCNQAIMLITDGSPSDFEDIFNRYNYPNAPVRVFTYLIGRETGDGTHTKMMACHNRGYYTHVINLAEVRETVQQYIPVMARPLVLNRTHPTTWTPAYGELTYQMLTDWIWESRRRERARAILAEGGYTLQSVPNESGRSKRQVDVEANANYPRPHLGISVTSNVMDGLANGFGGEPITSSDDLADLSDEQLEARLDEVDLFGYQSNPDCFWELRRNELTTTVVQPVYDQRNESKVVERFLNKNSWMKKESIMRTANLLGVAAADMKINDIVGMAPSHQLGPNGYAIMLTNNGLVMHHPDLRSILEPFTNEPGERDSRILKPFFSALDLVQVEHIDQDSTSTGDSGKSNKAQEEEEANFLALRNEAVDGKTGWRELPTKRTLDCQRRVQSRKQSFYYKPLEQFPFAFLVAIPQPYGSHKVEAQVEVKSSALPEKLTTYFTTSDYDLWSVHPEYNYCEGPSNNTISTLLDAFKRIEEGKLNEIQWRPAESTKPPIFLPEKIICDKDLLQSLVYDAVATFGFSEDCGPPPSSSDEASLMSMFGVRFSFVATRSGLTRVRHHEADDPRIKLEALAFVRRHRRAVDETFYERTVDFNMLVNETATLVQVPFNTHLKIQTELAELHDSNYDLEAGSSSAPSSSTRLNMKDWSLFEKLERLVNVSTLHVVATRSLIVNEGAQRAVAGVSGVFYDYATFVMRLLNATNANLEAMAGGEQPVRSRPAECYSGSGSSSNPEDQEACNEPIKCGQPNDSVDCLLVDNNGFILVSEQLEFVGRHLRAYDQAIMSSLVQAQVFHKVNVSDHQSICTKQEESNKPGAGPTSSSARQLTLSLMSLGHSLLRNAIASFAYTCTSLWAIGGGLLGISSSDEHLAWAHMQQQQAAPQAQLQAPSFQAVSALLPKKSYLRPCERILTRYETRPGLLGGLGSSGGLKFYSTRCDCTGWFVFEPVPQTNLLMLIVDSAPSLGCKQQCDSQTADSQDVSSSILNQENQILLDDSLNTQSNIIGQNEAQVCSMFERESKLHKRKLESCISHHQDEEQIKLCGSGTRVTICLLQSLPKVLALLLLFRLLVLVP